MGALHDGPASRPLLVPDLVLPVAVPVPDPLPTLVAVPERELPGPTPLFRPFVDPPALAAEASP